MAVRPSEMPYQAFCYIPFKYMNGVRAVANLKCYDDGMIMAAKIAEDPVTISASTPHQLEKMQKRLWLAFPYLSIAPLRTFRVELTYEEAIKFERMLMANARKFCVEIRFPQHWDMPFCEITGGCEGFNRFIEEM